MGRKSIAAIEREQRVVLAVIRDHPEGADNIRITADFARRTDRKIAYVTLRRRLDELEADGLIERKDARRRKPLYRPAVEAARVTAGAVTVDPDIALSPEATHAQALIRRPRQLRPPITYDPDFLDAYTPGSSWYLPCLLYTSDAADE